MTFGELFAGIGGFSLGLERAGMRCLWQVDHFCRQVLEQHWPGLLRLGDIRAVGPGDLPAVDLIAGGFPCQPVSVAGRQRGQEDERWLWPEFARIVGLLRPRFVIVENVPGLRIRGLGDVLRDLAALGYDAEWESLPAAAFGAPHVRDRVFVVAYPNGQGLEGLHQEGGREYLQPTETPLPGDIWEASPEVYRVGHGIPDRVDRTAALGNALVPQVAEWIGRKLNS